MTCRKVFLLLFFFLRFFFMKELLRRFFLFCVIDLSFFFSTVFHRLWRWLYCVCSFSPFFFPLFFFWKGQGMSFSVITVAFRRSQQAQFNSTWRGG